MLSVKGFHRRKTSASKQLASSGRSLFTHWPVSSVIAAATLVLSFFVDRYSQASSSNGAGFVTTAASASSSAAAFVIPVSTKHGHNSITMSSSNTHFHHTGNHHLQEDQTILPTPTKRNGQGHSTSSTSPTSVLMMMPGSTDETDGSGPRGDDSTDSRLSKKALVGPTSVNNPRSCILQVGVYAGQLCSIANTNDEMFSVNNDGRTGKSLTSLTGDEENDAAIRTGLHEFVDCLTMLTYSLWLVSKSLNLHLEQSIQNKLHLNSIKYPVEHCKVRDWIVGYCIVLRCVCAY